MSTQLVDRVSDLVKARNRELARDAALEAALGIGFSIGTFAFVFWISWFAGVLVARYFNVYAWQFGTIVTGVFFVVATWSAWRRVDPLEGLKPMTDKQLLSMLVIETALGVNCFSPRHASAGLALVLLGGPAGVFKAIGIWAHRIRVDDATIENAANLLASCRTKLSANDVGDPFAAIVLRRLSLIKVVPHGHYFALTLTDKGRGVLSNGKRGKEMRGSDQGRLKA